MRFSTRPSEHTLEQDLTSMIDVVFLLIVFFLTTISMSKLVRQTHVDLPAQAGEENSQLESEGAVINISRDGMYIVQGSDRTLVEIEGLVRTMVAATGERDVLVRADRSAPATALNALGVVLIDAGATQWSIATAGGSERGAGGER